jgi:hypothetical protein
MVSEEMRTIIKKPSTLHSENRKDGLRAFQELTKFHPLQAQGYERANSFESLPLEKRMPAVCPSLTGLPRCFSRNLSHQGT